MRKFVVAFVFVLLTLTNVNYTNSASGFPSKTRSPLLGQIARDSDIVAFNTSNYKFHALTCIWAERCTAHCISITRKEAHKRGGIPCKVCGGGE